MSRPTSLWSRKQLAKFHDGIFRKDISFILFLNEAEAVAVGSGFTIKSVFKQPLGLSHCCFSIETDQ